MTMHKPQVGDIVRLIPRDKKWAFYMVVEDVTQDGNEITVHGPFLRHKDKWEGPSASDYSPAADHDYILQDSPKRDRIWASYCAWRLTDES